jgi:hypothetical protein
VLSGTAFGSYLRLYEEKEIKTPKVSTSLIRVGRSSMARPRNQAQRLALTPPQPSTTPEPKTAEMVATAVDRVNRIRISALYGTRISVFVKLSEVSAIGRPNCAV